MSSLSVQRNGSKDAGSVVSDSGSKAKRSSSRSRPARASGVSNGAEKTRYKDSVSSREN